MSGPLVSASAAFVAKNSRIPPFAIEQSLRFSTDEFLTRTNSSGATDGQYGTLSVWYKMDSTTASSQLRTIIAGENSTYGHFFRFYTGKTDLHIGVWGSIDGGAYSAADFRDDSAWYHFLWQFDKTQSGVTNVNKLWVNGVAQTETSAGNFSSQNWGVTNNGSTVRIGHYQGSGSTQYARLKGYIAEMHVIDGSLKAATDFGEYDDNGVWRPIEYTGTYGNNGFYLKFDPSAANGIGHDHSGNGNNFTPYNFVTSGTGTDVMSDTPTTNWCTLNPLQVGYSGSAAKNVTFAEGNLKVTFNTTGGWQQVATSSLNFNSGKWYAESYINTEGGTYPGLGIGQVSTLPQGSGTGSLSVNAMTNSYHYSSTGQKVSDAGASSYGSTWTTGDTLGIAIDCDNNKIWWSKNGVWQASGDPAAGTNAAFTIASGIEYCIAVNGWSSASQTLNFGQRDFAYTPPTGFKPLNTANLPAPTVKDG
jgi:hypothetical protein